MIGRVACAALVSVALATPGPAARAHSQQAPAFRSATDLVSVAVSVRNGKVPVAGLTANDFELRDNGVRQQIDAIAIEAVPIDVTLLVDLSGSVLEDVDEFRSAVRALARMLRPIDRLRVVTFASGVKEDLPMQPATDVLDLKIATAGGATSLNDALLLGLLWPEEPGRRHLVIVFTDGFDTVSTFDNDGVMALGGQVDAVLHAVLYDWRGLLTPWMQASRAALIEVVRRTGGDTHRPGRALDDFKQILDDFHASYVVRYTARNVRREGWHDVSVMVVRPGAEKFTVRARKGYAGG